MEVPINFITSLLEIVTSELALVSHLNKLISVLTCMPNFVHNSVFWKTARKQRCFSLNMKT